MKPSQIQCHGHFRQYDGHLEFYYFEKDIMESQGQINAWNKFGLKPFKLVWLLLLAISIVSR